MKSRSHHDSTKKGFMIFFTVTLRSFIKYYSPPLVFCHATSRKMLKPTHPPTMHGVIIEQPLSEI